MAGGGEGGGAGKGRRRGVPIQDSSERGRTKQVKIGKNPEILFDAFFTYIYGGGTIPGSRVPTRFGYLMGSFGEDLRRERLTRGLALEDITAVTKISQHHLVALEQEQFRQLPGGILNKGIVRGYASAVGLDQQDWTDRFLRAYAASGQAHDDANDWEAFASNVGKARMQRHEATEFRVRWAGALFLLFMVLAGGFLVVRYVGVRAGWWSTLLPPNPIVPQLESAYISVRSWVLHLVS